MNRTAAVFAACSGASGVLLGAFGAHALRGSLDAMALHLWHTAVEYQFWHALALLAAAYLPPSRWRQAGVCGFGFGIPAFCGSLYALALGAPHAVGVITPLGGLAFVVGWLGLAGAFLRTAK